MKTIKLICTLITITLSSICFAQNSTYFMPEETELHEGTWIQWPHHHTYGVYFRDDLDDTWIAMADALQSSENVHIIVYDNTERNRVTNLLNNAGVPLTNIDFYVHPTDDVWVRDNGPVYVYDQNNNLVILDWGFNGWGNDTPYAKDDIIPQAIANDTGTPVIDLAAMVLEGGAVEHDGYGTCIATRSSVTHNSRNPNLTEADVEDYLYTYMGFENFIWLDGVYGEELTDMHIDGVMKFADSNTIVTMSNADLQYWGLSQADINTLYNATNIYGNPYNFVTVPLTQNNVVTTYGNNLGYKGAYTNYYIANSVVLIPFYNDPNDQVARNILQSLYPNRTVIGVDVRNLYESGGMIHCVTQQQPFANTAVDCSGLNASFTGLPASTSSSSPIALTGSPAGGTFSGTGVVFSAFNPSLAGPGLHSISYTYTDSNGCSATVEKSILVFNISFNFIAYNLGILAPKLGQVSIQTRIQKAGDYTINIYNLNGSLVSTEALYIANKTAEHRINVSYLTKGAYVVVLKNETASYSKKMIIQE